MAFYLPNYTMFPIPNFPMQLQSYILVRNYFNIIICTYIAVFILCHSLSNHDVLQLKLYTATHSIFEPNPIEAGHSHVQAVYFKILYISP